MRAATFNCNSIRSRLDAVLQWLDSYQPDFLCLQETKAQDVDFPFEAFESAGWAVAFKGEKSYNGVAIVSRKPARKVSFGLDEAPHDEARLIHAQYGRLHILNTYVPQGRELDHPMFAYKLEWFKRLQDYMQKHIPARAALLWCGDLNVARNPIDVFAPEKKESHVCYHQRVRDAFEAVIRSRKFVDVFRKHNPEAEEYSFYDYRAPTALKENHGWRIDYILGTPSIASKSTDSGIDVEPRKKPKASDHTPLWADFDFSP